MNNTVYLFFNNPCQLPADGDKWNNWTDPDTTKLAWACKDSWERNGWKVERITSKRLFGDEQFHPFAGRLKESIKFYPLEYWQFWFAMREFSKQQGFGADELMWFTTIDVFNRSFTPYDALRLDKHCPEQILTFQNQHFSASAGAVTLAGCNKIIRWITEYDLGKYPAIPCDLVSDETIIRNYGKYYNAKLCAYPVEPDQEKFPLVHIPKSTLTRLFGKACNEPDLC